MKSITLFLTAALLAGSWQVSATDPKVKGNLLLSTDNGATWNAVDRGFPEEEMVTAWVNLGDKLVAGTSKHGMYIFDTNTQKWTASEIGLPKNARIRSLNEKDGVLLASVLELGLYSSSDFGKTWQPAPNSPSNRIRKISVLNRLIYLATDEGIFISEGVDKPWRPVKSLVQVNDIILYGKDFYAATSQGIFKSLDGKNWENVFVGTAVSRFKITPNELVASTYEDRILISNSDGSAWMTMVPFVENQYICHLTETNSKIIIEKWMLGLSFLKVRKDFYSPESSFKMPFRTLIPVNGGVMLINTADIGC